MTEYLFSVKSPGIMYLASLYPTAVNKMVSPLAATKEKKNSHQTIGGHHNSRKLNDAVGGLCLANLSKNDNK